MFQKVETKISTESKVSKIGDSKKVAIYSANLIQVDWEERTQIIWLSPFLPRLQKHELETEDNSETENFKTDLLNYIQAYADEFWNTWASIVTSAGSDGQTWLMALQMRIRLNIIP